MLIEVPPPRQERRRRKYGQRAKRSTLHCNWRRPRLGTHRSAAGRQRSDVDGVLAFRCCRPRRLSKRCSNPRPGLASNYGIGFPPRSGASWTRTLAARSLSGEGRTVRNPALLLTLAARKSIRNLRNRTVNKWQFDQENWLYGPGISPTLHGYVNTPGRRRLKEISARRRAGGSTQQLHGGSL